MNLFVSHIQKFSLHDGPGIRTTIFLKGCSLKCAWCHNPETIPRTPVLQYYESKCISCGFCVNACPYHAIIKTDKILIDRSKCRVCAICTNECPTEALIINGKEMEISEIFNIIMQDKKFYENSKGGVTMSGGEPLLQSANLVEVLKKCKEENIHTAVDTAGSVGFKHFEEIMDYTDLFLYDLKIMDSDKHKKYTGMGNELILANFAKLYEKEKKIIVRVPVINGVNTNIENEKMLSEFLKQFPYVKAVEFLPMHTMAKMKYISLGLKNNFYEEY